MSMYSLIHGVNPLAAILLPTLGLEPRDCGRFRDCYLARGDDGETLEIHVHTRNGVGAWIEPAEKERACSKLVATPGYLRHYEEKFDPTYATFAFALPEHIRPHLEALANVDPSMVAKSPGDRFADFMQRLRNNPNDPEVQRVSEQIEPILRKLVEAMR